MNLGKYISIVLAAALLCGAVRAGSWTDKVKVKGDLRYRHEMIDVDDYTRHRHRLRARLGITGDVSEYTKVGIQLATGSDDPVSTNQTLDNGFSSKSVVLDLAYLKTTHRALPGLSLTAGKFKNPFFKPGSSELIWDSDWNPEGGVAVYNRDFDNVSLMLIGAGLWIDERKADEDSWLAAGQGVLRFNLNDKKSSFAVGGSIFNYVNAKDFSPFWDGDPMGNSTYTRVDTTVIEVNGEDDTTYSAKHYYSNDYELLELFAEATHKFDDIPVTVMADYVTNSAADSLNTGYLFGIRLGKAKAPGSWECRYIYRQVEMDAAVGTYIDSDFRGGGTDAKGHEVGGGIQLADNTTFNVTYFINEIGLEEAEGSDFNRLQVDLQLKF
jgi:hypothetical protein